jgi:hypothetical protein
MKRFLALGMVVLLSMCASLIASLRVNLGGSSAPHDDRPSVNAKRLCQVRTGGTAARQLQASCAPRQRRALAVTGGGVAG